MYLDARLMCWPYAFLGTTFIFYQSLISSLGDEAFVQLEAVKKIINLGSEITSVKKKIVIMKHKYG